jgi:DNA-directed RNA polymerase sigma subunit (sigma70/sigma32)
MQAVQALDRRSGAILIQQHGLDGQGGMSLADIGRALSLSRERVRQIADRASEQLRGHTILQALAAEDVRTAKAGPEEKTNTWQRRRHSQRKAERTV